MAFGIAYTIVFGKPLIFWGGITAISLVLLAAITGCLVLKGKAKLKTHKALAVLAIILAAIHGSLGMLAFL